MSLFHEVALLLRGKRAATVHGDTALKAPCADGAMLEVAMLMISEKTGA